MPENEGKRHQESAAASPAVSAAHAPGQGNGSTFAELAAGTLTGIGCRSVYCLPGVQNDDFLDALHGCRDSIEAVHVRHEQTAAYMACGAAQATGQSQAFCVVPGPGFLNAGAAIATAAAANARVLAIVGEIPSMTVGRNFGMLHEIRDQFGMLQRLCKCAFGIASAETAAETLSEAVLELESGKPGPVGLNVPTDLWSKCVTGGELDLGNASPRPDLDEDAIDRAAELLRQAKRPLIIIGGGAQSASGQVKEFVDALSAPATAFRNGHGVIPSSDTQFVSLPAAHQLWGQADVAIGLGTRLSMQQLQWGVDDDLKIIHIDIDKDAIGRIWPAEVGIHAALEDALPKLTSAILGRCRQQPDWAKTVAAARSEFNSRIEAKLADQLSYLNAIRQVLPEGGILVDEITQVGYVAKLAFPCFGPRTYLTAGHQGNLGCGLPVALGAAHACKEKSVVSISGDGGFMYACRRAGDGGQARHSGQNRSFQRLGIR